jgi:predicted phosphodiesterase
MRVVALSDIHIDRQANMGWLRKLQPRQYQDTVLILAGDISYDFERIRKSLSCLRCMFDQVFFVPGNHDLWIHGTDCADSLEKFQRLLELCHSLGIWTSPTKLEGEQGEPGIWIVPLFSWYVKPEEGADTLFVPNAGEDIGLELWADKYYTSWPALLKGTTVADYFLDMNETHCETRHDAPVISFSHFLPRQDLIFGDEEGENGDPLGHEREQKFNFSRVAGSSRLESQIRRLGSVIHVYGHQHRNRWRTLDGVLYVSHCLGYPHERKHHHAHGTEYSPICIWDTVDTVRLGHSQLPPT